MPLSGRRGRWRCRGRGRGRGRGAAAGGRAGAAGGGGPPSDWPIRPSSSRPTIPSSSSRNSNPSAGDGPARSSFVFLFSFQSFCF